MDEGGDGLKAVHDRQDGHRDQRGEDRGVDSETARLFGGEVILADIGERWVLEFNRLAAAAGEVRGLIVSGETGW